MKVQNKMPLTAGLVLGVSTGIPECDEFIRKYENCVRTGMPAAVRPAMLKALAQMRQTYRKAGRSPRARKSLATACTRTGKTMARSMARYKCTW